MKATDTSSNRFSAADWQTLGELEVNAGSDIEQEIQAWLLAALGPLDLHNDVQSKIMRSAREAASQALEDRDVTGENGHIHLLAFAPHDYASKGQTWGFFRLEKFADHTEDQSLPEHSIEFYLYLEG